MSLPPVPKKTVASQTLMRGLEIVDAVAQGKRTLQEISDATGIAFSTAHRLAAALVQIRYLQFEPRKGYRLGNKLVELGFMAYRESDLSRLARESLEWLAAQTLDTVHLAVLDDQHVVYLDKISGQRSTEVSSRIGGRKPVCTTGVGKALILDQGLDQWREHFLREHPTDSTPEALQDWLTRMDDYARAGYALDLGEDAPQIRCVAAPIHDGYGKTVAAISVSSTIDYTDDQRLQELVPIVQQVAAQISRQLGSPS